MSSDIAFALGGIVLTIMISSVVCYRLRSHIDYLRGKLTMAENQLVLQRRQYEADIAVLRAKLGLTIYAGDGDE